MIKVIENLFTMIKRRENDKLLENEVEGIMEIEDYIKLSEEEVKKYTYTIPVPQMFKYKGKVYRAYDKYYEEQVLSTLRTFRCAYFGEKKWNKMKNDFPPFRLSPAFLPGQLQFISDNSEHPFMENLKKSYI